MDKFIENRMDQVKHTINDLKLSLSLNDSDDEFSLKLLLEAQKFLGELELLKKEN